MSAARLQRAALAEASNRRASPKRLDTGFKATSGFEPLYEALQASA